LLVMIITTTEYHTTPIQRGRGTGPLKPQQPFVPTDRC